MSMNINLDNAIVINSDDEDYDDVVLVTEENATGIAEKDQEDDRIFISEKPSSALKCTPENQENKSEEDERSVINMSADDIDHCTTMDIGYFLDAFSSVVHDTSHPTDISQPNLLTTETLPTGNKQHSTLMTPSQSICDIKPVPEIGINTPDEGISDAGTASVKILEELDSISDDVDILEEKLDKEYMNDITNSMFTDEELKTRSESATMDTEVIPCPVMSTVNFEEICSQKSHELTKDLPSYWTPMAPGAPVTAFEVVSGSEEYKALAFQFYETLSFGEYDIVKIIRIQNPILWKYYALKQSEMVQENGGMDVEEKQLYHGTHRSILESIARKGFDWRLSGKHGTAFGNGTYFAKAARYSHLYTDCDGNGLSVKACGGLGYIHRRSTHFPYSRKICTTSTIGQHGQIPNSLSSLIQHFRKQASGPSQNLLVKPLPAHCHIPSLQPTYGHMPDQAHSKDTTIGQIAMPSGIISNCSSNHILPNASTSSFLQRPTHSNIYISCFNSSNVYSASSAHITQPLFSQNQSSTVQSRNYLTSPNLTSHVMPVNMHPVTLVGNSLQVLLRNINSSSSQINSSSSQINSSTSQINSSSSHIKPTAVNNNIHEAKGLDETEPTISYKPTILQIDEKGTTDLTAAFARDAGYKSHFMFAAKVLVGRYTSGRSDLKRPPPLDESDPYGRCYDSCVDDISSPQVHVMFDSNQSYPEYVIEYNWHRG